MAADFDGLGWLGQSSQPGLGPGISGKGTSDSTTTLGLETWLLKTHQLS